MDIQINDKQRAIELCNDSIHINNMMMESLQEFKTYLNKINQRWESNGNDKEIFMTEMEKQITGLEIISKSINNLSNNLKKYIEKNQTTSEQTLI